MASNSIGVAVTVRTDSAALTVSVPALISLLRNTDKYAQKVISLNDAWLFIHGAQ